MTHRESGKVVVQGDGETFSMLNVETLKKTCQEIALIVHFTTKGMIIQKVNPFGNVGSNGLVTVLARFEMFNRKTLEKRMASKSGNVVQNVITIIVSPEKTLNPIELAEASILVVKATAQDVGNVFTRLTLNIDR